jgi:hypothetical protein
MIPRSLSHHRALTVIPRRRSRRATLPLQWQDPCPTTTSLERHTQDRAPSPAAAHPLVSQERTRVGAPATTANPDVASPSSPPPFLRLSPLNETAYQLKNAAALTLVPALAHVLAAWPSAAVQNPGLLVRAPREVTCPVSTTANTTATRESGMRLLLPAQPDPHPPHPRTSMPMGIRTRRPLQTRSFPTLGATIL